MFIALFTIAIFHIIHCIKVCRQKHRDWDFLSVRKRKEEEEKSPLKITMEMIYVCGILPGSQAEPQVSMRVLAVTRSRITDGVAPHTTPTAADGAASKRHRLPSPRAHCVPGRLTVCGMQSASMEKAASE